MSFLRATNVIVHKKFKSWVSVGKIRALCAHKGSKNSLQLRVECLLKAIETILLSIPLTISQIYTK